MKLTVLIDNDTIIDNYYQAEPGVAYLIEENEESILFDTGYSDLFLRNAEKMGVDLSKLSSVVLSHGHDDHIGGLKHLIKSIDTKHMKLFAHPNAIMPKEFEEESIGTSLQTDEIENAFDTRYSKSPIAISETLLFLGEIPTRFDFEQRTPIGMTVNHTTQIPDLLFDDTALVHKGEHGLTIITGCSHSGICSTIEYAKQACNEDRISGVIGGFHLLKQNERAKRTIEYLTRQKIGKLCPSHCTSFAVRAELYQHTPVIPVGVGMIIEWE